MKIEAASLAEVAERHGIVLGGLEPVGGGCINACYRSGDYFLKFNRSVFHSQFEAEALALETLAATKTVRVPWVIGHGLAGDQAYLVLEYLPLQALSARAQEELGHQLAAMHGHTQSQAGFGIDNAIGATPQPNAPRDSWLEFWREQRLGYMLRLAEAQGHRFAGGDELLAKLDELLPESPGHSLLHGDLWAGNAASLPDGTPVVFDPATYYGHCETDLAMTRLFGGFSPAFYEAYDSIRPAEPGHERRVALYQLYHVLNHFVLFGGGYREQAQSLIQALLEG